MAAQNQHYVPKFILRQFLKNSAKEQVAVYDKKNDKNFITSIKNIMAERRFNDFKFDDDQLASFEPVACGTEDIVLPTYHRILEERRLDKTPKQQATLAILIAFQFLRTKAHRHRLQTLEETLAKQLEKFGSRMQDVEGWENWQPSSEETSKRNHLLGLRESLNAIAPIIAAKDFILIEPFPGRTFYLGDNPVSLANSLDFGPYGNLGLACAGIEIYMPLAADLMLGAWCPTILRKITDDHERGKKGRRLELLSRALSTGTRLAQVKQLSDRLTDIEKPADALILAAHEGLPISSSEQNMDYYNSLQTAWAHRYIVCKKSDFHLARRARRENRTFAH